VVARYTVTTWDEFQNILAAPAHLPRVILDLRRLLYPLELRIGAGIGPITHPPRDPINVYSAGEAFERARQALESLKGRTGRRRRALTEFRTGRQTLDRVMNLVYTLHDTLARNVSEKQWRTINVYMARRRQQAAAKRLEVNKSTVSRNL